MGVSRDLWHVYNSNFLRYLPILLLLILAFGGLGLMGLLVTLRYEFNSLVLRNIKIFLGFGLFASLA